MKWDAKLGIWSDDEWLVGIYDEMWLARCAVEDWGEGRPWDNKRELQITRYYKKRKSIFEPGEEILEGEPAVCEKEWMRYAAYNVFERSDAENVLETSRFYERGSDSCKYGPDHQDYWYEGA